jgi:hypothetical protein
MKKFLVLLCVIISVVSGAEFEYPSVFQPGEKIIQGGLGFGMAGMYGDVVIPPISLSIDIPKEIEGFPLSFGAVVGLSKSEYSYWSLDDYTWSYTYFLIGGRGAFHYKLDSDKLDTYVGIMLGYNIVSFDYDGPSYYGSYDGGESYLTYGGYVGGRYFFNEKWAYGELGYGFGYINVGIAYKL